MWKSFLNLLLYAWKYLVSLFGINVLYTILFSIFIPILIFFINSLYKQKQSRNGITLSQIIKKSLFSPTTIITGIIYLLVLFLIFSWGITYTTYKDHEDLKERIRSLSKENDNYKKDNSKDNKITGLEADLKKLKNDIKIEKESTKVITSPSSILNVSGLRAIPKPIITANPRCPHGLEIYLQTDVPIEPVGLLFEFNGKIEENVLIYFKSDAPIATFQTSSPLYSGYYEGRLNTFFFKYSSPALTPDKILVVEVCSKNPIQLVNISKLK